jgi:azurin
MAHSRDRRLDPSQCRSRFLASLKSEGALTRIKAGKPELHYLQFNLMKINPSLLLGVALITGLSVAGCGKSKNSAAVPSPAPAAAVAATAQPTDGRAIQLTANDTMKFNVTEIHAKPGEALAVTLTNEGTVPKFSMGHNWVLLAEGTDPNAFAAEAADAATTEYVPASFKDRVLASTKLLGPKESDTARFYAPKKPGHYAFLCAFPGHMQVGMKGELIVE